jgi:hypothetical protein
MGNTEEKNGILQDKVVRLVAVPRMGAMITDPNHIGYWMYTGTKKSFVLPKSRSRRALYPLLNLTEQKFFETALGLNLNLYAKKPDNFWHRFSVDIEKTDLFMKEGLLLNLADPLDNLKWRLLKIQPEVAPSWEERYDDGAFNFALVDEAKEMNDKIAKVNKIESAHKFLAKIGSSQTKLYDFLSIYWLQYPTAKRPNSDASLEMLKLQCQDAITTDLDNFLTVAEDSDYDMKLLVHRAMGLGAIDKKIMSKDYFTPEGKFLGNNLVQVISNLKQPEYQEDFLRIKSVVDATLPNEPKQGVTKKVKE